MATENLHLQPGIGQNLEHNVHIAEFKYLPLDQSTACVRLIQFELSDVDKNDNNIRCCTLNHVSLGEKPKYVALSYMWGDDTSKETVRIDGKKFLVGKNLFGALCYLQKRGKGIYYWIDAISINQDDILERNWQLRIMSHIYSRAQFVLVWLGQKFAHFDTVWHQGNPLLLSSLREEQLSMAKQLCENGYWKRVWIVQEVIMARRVQVCVYGVESTWDDFIKKMSSVLKDKNDSACRGPFTLDKHLREKYGRGLNLRQLLEIHQNAVCKDPRDKIYGLLALATNTRNFPVDYNKTVREVWKDTMLFAKEHDMISPSDIIPFGRLVKVLLRDPPSSPRDQIFLERISRTSSRHSSNATDKRQSIFKVSAYAVGVIVWTGSSPEQLVYDLDAYDNWHVRIERDYHSNLGDAHRERDSLMQAILDSETNDWGVLSFPPPHFRWKSSKLDASSSWSTVKSLCSKAESYRRRGINNDNDPSNPHQFVSNSASQLYHIQGVMGSKPVWDMGIAAGAAQPADLICWVPEVQKAVVVRVEENWWFHVVATATIPKDLCQQGKSIGEHIHKEDTCIDLKVDLETLGILIA